jgi:DNA-binding Lrp family transcriptional regulator
VATSAFILIEATVGKVRDVVTQLRTIEDVRFADAITGPYDVIALIESEHMGAVADLVTGRVQAIPGVVRTITCVTAG